MAGRTPAARVTLTLSNLATTDQLVRLEERLMSALTEAVSALRSAVDNAAARLGDPSELERALAEERRVASELAASEQAEDVQQNAELQAAKAEVDRLLGEQTAAAQEITAQAARLNAVGAAVEDAGDDTPVGEVEVPDTPVAEPVPAGTDVAPEDSGAVPPGGVPADGGAPTDEAPDTSDNATVPATADSGTPADSGPTDADGNPVAPPTI